MRKSPFGLSCLSRYWLKVVFWLAGASTAGAGCVYNFSEYNNFYPSSDGSTLYYSVSAVDNSGCGYSEYTTVANMQSPSGGTSSSSQAGLASTASMAFDNEVGTYSVYTTGSFYCPCAQQIVYNGWGTGGYVTLALAKTAYKNPVPFDGGCEYTSTACTSGTPTCTGGVLPTMGGTCPSPITVAYLRVTLLGATQCYAVLYTTGASNCY